jgi:hypothetical protein
MMGTSPELGTASFWGQSLKYKVSSEGQILGLRYPERREGA